MELHKITTDEAKVLIDSKWWLTATPEEIVRFQLFTNLLCLPFDKFHEAIEKCLDRPVWTHEFGLDLDGIQKEFLGEKQAPTMEEIIGKLPKDKIIIVGVENGNNNK